MTIKTKKSEETCERLLKVAAEHFAAQGYRQARVADICHEAEANQAAVSYHFGGKYELYESSLKHALEIASAKFPLPCDESLPPEERLRQFLSAACRRIFDESEGSLFPKMMVKEMAEPTEALETILRDLVAKERDIIIGIVREILGPKATEEDLILSHLSIVALFQFFNFSRSIRQMLQRKLRKEPPNIEHVIQHTVGFALAGLHHKQAEIAARV
ncbi:CerR family C-terminal domain-containing protein [Cerasicoccus maritimus]|uniref:CerR family C-terminal domain-containing protein n=1 Tax=Cerasicoccus maritimus TaxID=490089 RepID=UPI0028527E35|nr:CerR family C-terminal domain-containing protein [Cerasicoccus maritimus]